MVKNKQKVKHKHVLTFTYSVIILKAKARFNGQSIGQMDKNVHFPGEVYVFGEKIHKERPMPKSEYRSAIRSRRLINQALAELMQEKPLDKITVTDVVKRADINRGTFYAHYTDVSDVVTQQMEAACQTLRTALADRGPEVTAGDAAFVLRKLQALFEENLEFFSALLSSSLATAATEQLRDIFIDYMMQHPPKDLPTDRFLFLIRFASGGLSAMYRDWVAGKLPMTFDQLNENAIAMVESLSAHRE